MFFLVRGILALNTDKLARAPVHTLLRSSIERGDSLFAYLDMVHHVCFPRTCIYNLSVLRDP